MKQAKRLVFRLLPWIVIGIVVYFFAVTLSRNWDKVAAVSLEFSWLHVLASLCFVGAVVVSGLLWGKLLGRLSSVQISTRDAIRIHCASWLLKYVPGQVGSLVNKLLWGTKQGISKKTVTASFLYENILLVLASAALSLPVLALFGQQLGSDGSLFLPLLFILPLLIVLRASVFYGVLNYILRLVHKAPFSKTDALSTRGLAMYFVGYLIPRLLNGIGFVCVAAALFSVTPDMYVGLIAIYALAGVIGLLAIFVPSGIGVREAVIVALASAYFPTEQAIILSLVARFYATIADIGVGAVYLVLNNGRIKQQ